MSTIQQLAILSTSNNAATYTAPAAGTFTPTNGDLLVVVAAVTAETNTNWAVSDSLGGAWTKIRRQTKTDTTSGTDILEVWVRNTVAPASTMTVTYSHASGNATGCFLKVMGASNMVLTGSSAVRSQGGQDNVSGSAPAPALNQSALTTNGTITAILNGANPTGITVPTNWTLFGSDAGIGTPTTGFEVARRATGFTGTTITWGTSSASAFCSVVIELDSTGPVPADSVSMSDADANFPKPTFGDSATMAESRVATPKPVLADTTTPADATAKAARTAQADTVTPTETTAKAFGRGTQADSVTSTDATVKAFAFVLADSVGLSDSAARALAKLLVENPSLADDVVTDYQSGSQHFTLDPADSVALVEAVVKGVVQGTTADSLTVTEGFAKNPSVLIAEVLDLAELAAFVATFNRTLADDLILSEGFSPDLVKEHWVQHSGTAWPGGTGENWTPDEGDAWPALAGEQWPQTEE